MFSRTQANSAQTATVARPAPAVAHPLWTLRPAPDAPLPEAEAEALPDALVLEPVGLVDRGGVEVAAPVTLADTEVTAGRVPVATSDEDALLSEDETSVLLTAAHC